MQKCKVEISADLLTQLFYLIKQEERIMTNKNEIFVFYIKTVTVTWQEHNRWPRYGGGGRISGGSGLILLTMLTRQIHL